MNMLFHFILYLIKKIKKLFILQNNKTAKIREDLFIDLFKVTSAKTTFYIRLVSFVALLFILQSRTVPVDVIVDFQNCWAPILFPLCAPALLVFSSGELSVSCPFFFYHIRAFRLQRQSHGICNFFFASSSCSQIFFVLAGMSAIFVCVNVSAAVFLSFFRSTKWRQQREDGIRQSGDRRRERRGGAGRGGGGGEKTGDGRQENGGWIRGKKGEEGGGKA